MMRSRLLAQCAGVDRVVPKFFFDTEKLIVLGDTVGAAHGAGLDLARVGGHGDVGDSHVFGLTGTVGNDGIVAVDLSEFDGLECFGSGCRSG